MAGSIFPSCTVGVLVIVSLAVLMAALFVAGGLLAWRKKWRPAAVCLGVAVFLAYAIFPWGVYHIPA